MNITPDAVTEWIYANPTPAAIIGVVLVAALGGTVWALWRVTRSLNRPPAAVLVASLAAAACTAYSADTSWRFAAHKLGMTETGERAAMFAAGELALFACALMARSNLHNPEKLAPGAPGVLVWGITGIQIIPAYTESGFWGGTVRAVLGPVLAALLWHLAMGLDLRHARPDALSNSIVSQVGRELRERLLSWLGLSVRDRSAEQITRDRWTVRAVDLAVRLERRGDGGRAWVTNRLDRRLSKAIGRSGVASSPNQREELIRQLGARRNSGALATITLPSPWDPPQPPARPRTLGALAHQQLTEMHPMDAIRQVQAAHPHLTPAELASMVTAHGVVTSEQLVRVAIGAKNHRTPSAPAFAPGDTPALDAPAASEVHPEIPALASAVAAAQHRSAVHARVPEAASDDVGPASADEPEAESPDVESLDPAEGAGTPGAAPGAHSGAHSGAHLSAGASAPAEWDPLAEQARALGRPASLRTLKNTFRIGQHRAQKLQRITASKGE